jgi:hypothetical protein
LANSWKKNGICQSEGVYGVTLEVSQLLFDTIKATHYNGKSIPDNCLMQFRSIGDEVVFYITTTAIENAKTENCPFNISIQERMNCACKTRNELEKDVFLALLGTNPIAGLDVEELIQKSKELTDKFLKR